MKLQIKGKPPGALDITLVDMRPPVTTSLPLRTVTRFTIDVDGAALEIYVPELELEVEIPNETGETIQAIEKLRRRIDELETENRALARELDARPT